MTDLQSRRKELEAELELIDKKIKQESEKPEWVNDFLEDFKKNEDEYRNFYEKQTFDAVLCIAVKVEIKNNDTILTFNTKQDKQVAKKLIQCCAYGIVFKESYGEHVIVVFDKDLVKDSPNYQNIENNHYEYKDLANIYDLPTTNTIDPVWDFYKKYNSEY